MFGSITAVELTGRLLKLDLITAKRVHCNYFTINSVPEPQTEVTHCEREKNRDAIAIWNRSMELQTWKTSGRGLRTLDIQSRMWGANNNKKESQQSLRWHHKYPGDDLNVLQTHVFPSIETKYCQSANSHRQRYRLVNCQIGAIWRSRNMWLWIVWLYSQHQHHHLTKLESNNNYRSVTMRSSGTMKFMDKWTSNGWKQTQSVSWVHLNLFWAVGMQSVRSNRVISSPTHTTYHVWANGIAIAVAVNSRNKYKCMWRHQHESLYLSTIHHLHIPNQSHSNIVRWCQFILLFHLDFELNPMLCARVVDECIRFKLTGKPCDKRNWPDC